MQKLVLFDFDGTLADTAPDLAATANEMRALKGLPPLPYEHLRPQASKGARGLLKASLDMDPDHPEYEAHRIQFLDLYAQQLTQHTTLFPGVPQLLSTLTENGYKWGIVTNKIEALALPIVRHFQLDLECAVTVGGDTVGVAKPHPAPLLHAAQQVGVAPHSCLYIGDDERDIVAGKAAGMPTVAAAYGYCQVDDIPRWNADAVVHAAGEIWPVVQALFKQAA
jgi:phosphoglycolate phosphatase